MLNMAGVSNQRPIWGCQWSTGKPLVAKTGEQWPATGQSIISARAYLEKIHEAARSLTQGKAAQDFPLDKLGTHSMKWKRLQKGQLCKFQLGNSKRTQTYEICDADRLNGFEARLQLVRSTPRPFV